MGKTLGLALGSGGSRGVAHVGFLAALEEEGIKPDYIAGCSMGAVVGGCYASGMSVSELMETLQTLKTRDILDISPAIISKMSILRGKKLYDLLVEKVKVDTLEEMKIPFQCVATELLSGKLHVFKEGNAALAMQASSTIPTVFRPVKYDNKMFVDGGCLCRVPVNTVKEMGADVVVAVDVIKDVANPVEDVQNIIAMVLRVFDVMDAHITKMSRALECGICDILVEPELDGMNGFDTKEVDRAYEAGYDAGKQNVQKIKELLK